MAQRNVMPTLPNQRPQQMKKPSQNGNKGINIKAIVILVIIIIGIVVLLIVKGNEPNKYENSSSSSESSSSVESSEPEEPPVPVEKDPSENSGTQMTDLLVDGSVFKTENKYVLATDIAYPGAISVADNTVISLDNNLTLVPSASCAYSYEFNTANITHSSGALLTVTRRQSTDRRNMPTTDDYKASLEEIAVANGIDNPTYGEVYVGSSKCGMYVKGNLKANKEVTDKTILILHCSGDPEIYSLAVIYKTQDELDLLFNSVKLYNSSLKLN